MFRPATCLFLCIAVLPAVSANATTAAGVGDPTTLEARWHAFSRTAAQSQPALDFPYAHCFRRAATAHDLPETLLLAVARGESDFDPVARSKANAYGLMQILWPDTARYLGVDRLSELLDPCTNVEAGARYLKELLGKYQGNLHRALAAYNYGPGRIPAAGGSLPKGAVWYSGYILRHLDYVLHGDRKGRPAAQRRPYSEKDRLFIIHFSRPYRAAAFVENLQPRFGDIRLDWFRLPDGGFDVVMLYTSEKQLSDGQRLLSGMGF
jgi:hypothetical protein